MNKAARILLSAALILCLTLSCVESLALVPKAAAVKQDAIVFAAIDAAGPKSQQMLYRYNSGFTASTARLSNLSSMVTLLNRRLARDGRSGSFTPKNVLEGNNCTGIASKGVKYTYTGSMNAWYGRQYSNGTYDYKAVRITAATVKSSVKKANFYYYLANLLHQHPEGIILRHKQADHAVVIDKYTVSGSKIQLYVKDPVGNFSGKLEGSWFYGQCNGGDIYNDLAFIVYLEPAAGTDTQKIIRSGEKFPEEGAKVIEGKSFALRGQYAVNKGTIKKVTATLTYKATSVKIYKFTCSPNAATFDVDATKGTNGRTLNATMVFGNLAPDDYVLTVNIDGSDGAAYAITRSFTVTSGMAYKVNVAFNAPNVLSKGSSFGLRGKVTISRGMITKVTATIKDLNGVLVPGYKYTAAPNSTNFDIRYTVNQAFLFGKLEKGGYTYSVKITAKYGTETKTFTYTRPFTVK